MGYTDLTVSAYDSLGVTVQLKGYSPSAKEFVASQKKINWRKTDEGWFLFSDWTVIDTFIAFLKEHGNAKVASRAERLPLLQNNEEAQRELERPLCRICVDYHGDMGKELFLSINTRDNEPVSYLYKHAKTLHNIDTKVAGNKVYFTCSEHSLGVLKSLSRQNFS